METMLGLGSEARDEKGWRVFAEKGADVAAMTMMGDELVVEFVPPRACEELDAKKRFYRDSRDREGWLQYRRPATRDPRPDLEANLGSIIGSASWERNKPPAFHALHSAGGPYVCLPVGRVVTWGGFIEEGGKKEFPKEHAMYQRVMKCGDGGELLALEGGVSAIVLGTPDALYWKSLDGGGVLARVVSFDADDDAALEKMLSKLPAAGWKAIGDIETREPYRAFDAAEFGGNIGEGNSLAMEIAPGRYAVAATTWAPDDGTELLLVRLTRTKDSAKKAAKKPTKKPAKKQIKKPAKKKGRAT
jgi:hypothetical protein